MIELKKDSKSETWIITTTDNEGFHRQVNVTEKQMNKLIELWKTREISSASLAK